MEAVKNKSDSEQRDNSIVKMYSEENYTMEEIGFKFGLTRQRIQQILQGRGIYNEKRRVSRDRLNQFQWAEKTILNDYINSGLSIENISSQLGISPRTVRTIFQKNEIPKNHTANVRKNRRYEDIYRFTVENPDIPYSQIAEKFDVSVMTVSRALRSKNYYRRGQNNGQI